jgi:hypothetical protein
MHDAESAKCTSALGVTRRTDCPPAFDSAGLAGGRSNVGRAEDRVTQHAAPALAHALDAGLPLLKSHASVISSRICFIEDGR